MRPRIYVSMYVELYKSTEGTANSSSKCGGQEYRGTATSMPGTSGRQRLVASSAHKPRRFSTPCLVRHSRLHIIHTYIYTGVYNTGTNTLRFSRTRQVEPLHIACQKGSVCTRCYILTTVLACGSVHAGKVCTAKGGKGGEAKGGTLTGETEGTKGGGFLA